MSFPHHHLHGFMFHPHDDSDQIPSSRPSPSYPPQTFPGGSPFTKSMTFSGVEKCEHDTGDDELSDDGLQLGEKKKRLNLEQVKALEKSFELGNKLEPERKMQLAKALGLQPRQVAIWFQNRRARWKTKQLEKDYEVLKKQFDCLKADNETLQVYNKKLRAELIALRGRDSDEVNLRRDQDQGYWSNGSENSCDVNLNISREHPLVPSSVSSQLTMSHHQLPPSSSSRPATMTQFLQGSARPPPHSSIRSESMAHEENFGHIFTTVGEQQGIWPWQEQLANFALNHSHFSNN